MDSDIRAGHRRAADGGLADGQREVVGEIRVGNMDSAIDKYRSLVDYHDLSLEHLVSDPLFSGLIRSVEGAGEDSGDDENSNDSEDPNASLRQIVVDQARKELGEYGLVSGTGAERELYFVHPRLKSDIKSSTSNELKSIMSIVGRAIYLDNLLMGNLQKDSALIYPQSDHILLISEEGNDRTLSYLTAYSQRDLGLFFRFHAEDQVDDQLSVGIVDQIAEAPESAAFFEYGDVIVNIFDGKLPRIFLYHLPSSVDDVSNLILRISFEDIESTFPSVMQSFIDRQGFDSLGKTYRAKHETYFQKETKYFFGEGVLKHSTYMHPRFPRLDLVRKYLGITNSSQIHGDSEEGITIALDGDFPGRGKLFDIAIANSSGENSLDDASQGCYFITNYRDSSKKNDLCFRGEDIGELAETFKGIGIPCEYSSADLKMEIAETISFGDVYDNQIDKILDALFIYVQDQAEKLAQAE